MPVVGGKVIRSRYTALKLDEISSVDTPAQPGATASLLKRHGAPSPAPVNKLLSLSVAKYICEDDGAHTFEQVLQANNFDEQIWPMVSALSQSIRSIMGDNTVVQADRETQVQASVDQFLASVRDISPTAEKRLAELITKGKTTMDWEAIAKAAQAQVADLTSKLAIATADVEKAKADAAAADEKVKTATADKEKAEKALTEATDEVIKINDSTEVRKSVVGEGQFAVTKALMDDRDTARIEKRVETDFRHVTGTTVEKALVLKAADKMDEPTRKAFDAIIRSAEKMAASGFDRLGHGGGGQDNADVAKALGDFNGKIAEIAKRDSLGRAAAMRKAREEAPELFAKAYPQDAAN